MNKISWLALLMSTVTLAACSPIGMKTANRNAKGSEVSIKVEKPISVISFKIKAQDSVKMTGFEVNEKVFNTELQNVGDGLEREISLAVMKSSSEMPSGEIVVGTVLHEGKGEVEVAEVSLVESGEAGSEVVEKKIDNFKLYLKK